MVNEMLASTYSLLGRSLAAMTTNSVLHGCIDTKLSRIPYGWNELVYMWSRFLLRQRCLLCLCAESRMAGVLYWLPRASYLERSFLIVQGVHSEPTAKPDVVSPGSPPVTTLQLHKRIYFWLPGSFTAS